MRWMHSYVNILLHVHVQYNTLTFSAAVGVDDAKNKSCACLNDSKTIAMFPVNKLRSSIFWNANRQIMITETTLNISPTNEAIIDHLYPQCMQPRQHSPQTDIRYSTTELHAYRSNGFKESTCDIVREFNDTDCLHHCVPGFVEGKSPSQCLQFAGRLVWL